MLTTLNIYKACEEYLNTSSNCTIYFLADHAGLPGLTKILDKTRAEWVSLFARSREENAISVAPILFRVQFENARPVNPLLVNWICTNGSFNSSIVFLATPLSLLELAERLTCRLDATLPDNISVLLRFYDPRIFDSLCTILPTEKKREFFSPACCWWYISRKAEICVNKSEFADLDTFASPLALNETQQNFLLDASTFDQVDDLLMRLAKNYYMSLPALKRYEFLEKNMANASLKGIESVYEISLYCAKILAENNRRKVQIDHVK